MKAGMHQRCLGLAGLCLVLAGQPCSASGLAEGSALWLPVAPDVLERLRGGFTTGSGLNLALGIERQVTINGEVLVHSIVHIANVGQLDTEQAQQISHTLRAVKLIQNGDDNIYHAATTQYPSAVLAIQNSLDGQQLASRTVINASVNSLGILTALNFQGSLGDALAHAAAPN